MTDQLTPAKRTTQKTAARKTAKDFPPELLELYDHYVHGQITRREFMDKAARFAVAGVTAAMLVNQLAPDYALAKQVDPEDPEIVTARITYPSPKGHGEVNGYLVKPANATGPLPAILVVHENRGLNPYIEDVARRMAKAGFVALAPDGLTVKGGYPGTDDEGRKLQREVDPVKLLEDFFAGYEFLRDHPDTTDKTGAVGFCYGGGVVNALAVAYADLDAGVPFYGRQAPLEDAAKIEAPLMIQYAENDPRINAGAEAYTKALQDAGKDVNVHLYPGVNHGFHNDTTPRYDEAAARLAEDRTIAFFRKHLTGD